MSQFMFIIGLKSGQVPLVGW